jgi:hypothetical protein
MPPLEKSAQTGSVRHPANMAQSPRSTPIACHRRSWGAGLADLRDWLVLALISGDGTQRTQLEIATQLGGTA